MEVISSLLNLALQECFEQGIDITDETVTFEAECEIDISGSVATVTICGWLIFIGFFRFGHGWDVYYAMQQDATLPPYAPPEKDSDANWLGDFDTMHA